MRHILDWLDRVTRKPSTLRGVIVAAIVAIVVIFAVLFWQVHQNSAALTDAAAVARARGQALGTANAKLTQNGIPAVKPTDAKPTPGKTDVGPTTPATTPKVEGGQQGETGAQGEQGPGPSPAQVKNAVADYCDAHSGCKGGPTKAQVAAAVITYCTAKDDCQGPAGEDGTDATGEPGQSGKSGSPGASGEPGRAPTADEISAAVAAFCADGACRGPAGPAGSKGDTGASGQPGRDGNDGKPGADAPHFTKITCQSDNTWLFTLSDGSTLTAAGPCRAETVTVTAPPTSEPSSSPEPTSTAP